MTKEGLIRAVVEKRAVAGLEIAQYEVEVLWYETFDTGMCGDRGPAFTAHWAVNEMGVDEQMIDAVSEFGEGFYEVLGEVWYEYHPGVSTPDGPAEPDAWWGLYGENVQKLTDEQASWFMESDPVLTQ